VRLIADAEQQEIRRASRRDDAEVVRSERGCGIDIEFQDEAGEAAFDDAAADCGIEKDDSLRAVQVLAEDGDRNFSPRRPALWIHRRERREAGLDFLRRA